MPLSEGRLAVLEASLATEVSRGNDSVRMGVKYIYDLIRAHRELTTLNAALTDALVDAARLIASQTGDCHAEAFNANCPDCVLRRIADALERQGVDLKAELTA